MAKTRKAKSLLKGHLGDLGKLTVWATRCCWFNQQGERHERNDQCE